jgi:hypothetical protein
VNILQQFYILFKSDADKARKETSELKRSAEEAAVAIDATGAAHEAAGAAAVAAAAVATVAQGEKAAAAVGATAVVIAASEEEIVAYTRLALTARAAHATAARAALEDATAENVAARETTKAALAVAEARLTEATASRKAAESLSEESAAYAFNRAQRQEFTALARHSFDQLASGGSIMRVVSSHAATLGEALSMGPGGLAAGAEAAGQAALRFVQRWGLVLGVLGAVVAAVGIAKGSVDSLNETRINAARTGLEVEDYDAIRKVIRNLGGDTKEADRDLQRFATRIDDAYGNLSQKKPDQVAKAFHAIGVSIRNADGSAKNTKTTLLDLAGALEKLNPEKRAAALRGLGFETPRHGKVDEGFLKLLMSGRASMEQWIETEKRLGGVTKEQVEVAHKYKIEVEILADRFRDLRNVIATYVLPALQDVVHAVREGIEWIRLNSTLVKGMAIGIVTAISIVTAAIWGQYIPAVTAAALRTIIAFAPFFAIAAAIAAIAFTFGAIFEDISFYLKGQPSLLGELVNKYQWVKKAIEGVGEGWDTLKQAAKGAFAEMEAFIGPIFRLIRDLAQEIGRPILIIFGQLAAAAGGFFRDNVGNWLKLGEVILSVAKFVGKIWDAMLKGWLLQINFLISSIRALFGLKPDAQVQAAIRAAAISVGQAQMTTASQAPLANRPLAGLGGGPMTQTNTVHIDRVDVQTQASDADGIARGINGALGQHIRQATSAFDNGLDR